MADRIKGITIVIGADASGLITLDKALKPINSSMRKTGEYLKDVNKLMKFNPSSFTLLGQKQGYLKQQITDTKASLDNLKAAQMALDEKMKAGLDVDQEEYKKLQREIIETEGKLKKLNREFIKGGGDNKIAQGFVAMGTAIKEAGDKLKDFGKQLSGIGRELTPISGAFAAVGVGSLKLNKKWDTAFDNMIYKSGKTGESAQELRDLLKKMYAGSAFELTDISDTIGQVSARFKGLSNAQIEEMSDSLLKFQKITGTDAKKSVDDLGKTLAGFNIPAKDYKKVLDGLVTAQTETGADVEKIIKNVTQYGAAMRTVFGNDINTTIGILASLDKQGVNTQRVVMALQQASTKQLKGMTPEQVKKGFEDLFKTLKSGVTNVDEMKKALELMGSRGGLALVDAFQTGKLSWDEMVAAIEGGGTTVEGVFNETYNAEEKNRQKLHEMEVAAVDFAASVADVVTPALEKASDKIGWLKEKWDKLDSSQQSNILKIGGIIAIAAPALIIIGKVIGALGTIISFLGTIFQWIGWIGGAFTTLGLGPVAGVLAAVVAVLAVLWQFRKPIEEAYNAFNKWAGDKINPLLKWRYGDKYSDDPNLQFKGSGIVEYEKHVKKIEEAYRKSDIEAKKFWDNEAKRASGQAKLHAEEQARLAQLRIENSKTYDEKANAFEGATNRMLKAFGLTSQAANTESDKVKAAFTRSKDGMNGIGQQIGNAFGGGLRGSKLIGDTNTVADRAKTALKGIGNGAYGWGEDAGTQWGRGLSSTVGKIRAAAENVARTIKARLGFSVPETGPLSDANTYMPDFIDLMVQGINQNKQKLLGAVSSLAGDIKTDLGLNPDVTNTLTNNTVFQPVNNFAITIGNREIKDYAVQAVTSTVSNKMKAQNMSRGVL